MIDQEEFIKRRMMAEVQALVDSGFKRIAVGMISQYIETLGAFLDKKPFKTPRQSSQRFDLALKKLFPPRYSGFNKNNFLYKQLRSNFTHLGVESQFLTFDYNDENIESHMRFADGKTTIVISKLLEDYINACNLVIEMLVNGRLKNKNLS